MIRCHLLVSLCSLSFCIHQNGWCWFIILVQSPEPQRWMTLMWPSRWSTAMSPKLWDNWMTSAETQSECLECARHSWSWMSEWLLMLLLFLLGEILFMQPYYYIQNYKQCLLSFSQCTALQLQRVEFCQVMSVLKIMQAWRCKCDMLLCTVPVLATALVLLSVYC